MEALKSVAEAPVHRLPPVRLCPHLNPFLELHHPLFLVFQSTESFYNRLCLAVHQKFKRPEMLATEPFGMFTSHQSINHLYNRPCSHLPGSFSSYN